MAKNKLIHHHILPFAYSSSSRRLFLKSSVGYIALPFIASLLPKVAWGADENEALYRRMVFMINQDGSHYLDSIPRNVAYQNKGNGVMAGSLANAQLGPIYNNDFQNLRNKLSIIMGLSAQTGANHSNSTPLAASFSGYQKQSSGFAVNGSFSLNPDSIDTILSNKIYSSNHPALLKCIRFSGGYSYSRYNKSEVLNGVPQYSSMGSISEGAARKLLMDNSIFSSSSVQTSGFKAAAVELTGTELENEQRRYVLERALASLSLTKKSGKISANAKSKISDYQEMLAAVRDGIPQLSTTPVEPEPTLPTEPETPNQPPATGGEVPTGTPDPIRSCNNVPTNSDVYKDRANIICAALACGATRLAVTGLPSNHSFAHEAGNPSGRDRQKDFLRNTVLTSGAYLMSLMDQIEEGNGNTLLENSAVLMTSTIGNSASSPHNGHSMRVIVGGGLNGKLRMGEAINFQDTSYTILNNAQQKHTSQGERGDIGLEQVKYAGRPYNELLITFMRAFGLNQSDYSVNGAKGYGQYHIEEIPGEQYWYVKHLQKNKPDHVQYKVMAYMKNRFLPGYNRDSVLSYYYKG